MGKDSETTMLKHGGPIIAVVRVGTKKEKRVMLFFVVIGISIIAIIANICCKKYVVKGRKYHEQVL